MLDWLTKLFRRHEEAAPLRRPLPDVLVVHDDKSISVRDETGHETTLGWADVERVSIITSCLGPFEPDLTWILLDRDGRRHLAVPMGAEGEPALLRAMQQRLVGFDNMAVVEAMSSIRDEEFQVWPAVELI